MSSSLQIGTILKEKYQIVSLFGQVEGTAAYLVMDLLSQEQLLLWESAELFKLRGRPPGAREYFQQEGKHYLLLRLEGQTLALMLTAAGRLVEASAGIWVLQICRAVGYWHNRPEGALLCLQQGSLALSVFKLSDHDLVMVPSLAELGRAGTPVLEADEYRFSAPQPELESPTPRSDVYALGAMLYCLLTGRLPAAPEARLAREARLESPRKLNPDLSRNMEKVVLKALDLDPRRRYPTAAEMAIDLEKFLVQQAMAGPEPDKKPSLLARALPFLVSLVLLCCLVVVVEAITKETIIKIPWLKGWPTATYTPTVPSPLAGRLTSTPQPTATPLPVSRVVLNQIRVDQFPRLIAYAGALDDKQEPYLGLPWERWRMQQDGIPVNDFQMVNASLVREPLAVVVAIDISRSMAGERLQNVQTAVANFVLGLDPADQVALIAFNNQVRLVYDFTINKEAIVEATNTLTTGLDTALFDVIAFSADKLSAWPGRRTIVLLTDGRDTASTQHDVNGAIAAANEGAIPVFVVDLNRYHERPDTLEGISYDTRGDYLFAPNAGDLDALYQKVRLQLQNQYRFEFMSRHLADEANHALRVGLDLSGGQELWSEKGYRVP